MKNCNLTQANLIFAVHSGIISWYQFFEQWRKLDIEQ